MRLMIVKDVFFYLRIFLPVIFFASSYSFGQNYWLRQNSPTNKDLVKCEFADSLFGWVCGDSGVILHTTDAGASWQTQASGITDYKIEEIFFINRNLGWALSNDYQFRGTDLLTTTNGGINWLVTKFPEPNLVFNTIYFLNSLLGFITGQTGNIFKTTNGGINWIQCMIDSSACPYMLPKIDIHFINAMTGFSCGGAIDYTGVVWKTTNGGEIWSALCLTPEPMNVIKPISVNRIVAMGGDPEYGVNAVYSTNNGVSWIYELTPCFGAATGFSLRTPAEGWAVLSYSNVMGLNLDSMKPGTHWQCIPTPEGALLYDIQFTTPTLGWAFGKSGAIFKYNKDIIAVNGNQNNIPNDYVLYQNYPNPFNPVTLIKFEIPKPGFINLTVYDINGREVAVLVNKELKPGTYEAQWDGSTSAGGVYFYRLDAGNSAFPKICRKMVLIK